MTIILTLAYNFLIMGNKIFTKGTNESYVQQEVRFDGDYIVREIRNASIVSANVSDVSALGKYYSLGIKTFGSEKYLVKQTINGGTITEIKVGSPISSLLFLKGSKSGMLKVQISDDNKGQNYDLNFEFLLNNISSVNINNPGSTIIYYANN